MQIMLIGGLIDLKDSSMAFVYIITNKINQKQYVGVTSHTIERRFKEHQARARKHLKYGDSDVPVIALAMAKHGLENFEVETLFEGGIEECFQKEIEFISSIGTKCPKGYNMTDGGEGVRGHQLSQKHLHNLRTGAYWKDGIHPMKGKKASKETREIQSELKQKQTTLGGVTFKSVGEAASCLGLTPNTIRRWLEKEQLTAEEIKRVGLAERMMELSESRRENLWALQGRRPLVYLERLLEDMNLSWA